MSAAARALLDDGPLARRSQIGSVASNGDKKASAEAELSNLVQEFPHIAATVPLHHLAAMMGGSPEAVAHAANRRLRIYSAAELDDIREQEWLWDGKIPAGGIVGIIGPKGVKKTFLTLTLAFHLATGHGLHGSAMRKVPVLYIYSEGAYGAKLRMDAMCKLYSYLYAREIKRENISLYFLPRSISVNEPLDVAEVIAEANTLPEKPGAIIIDTVNQNINGAEDDRGMNGFVRGCLQLRDAFDATLFAVHHTPLATDDRGRGHSALDGALDTRFIVSCDADRVTLECTHQRNGVGDWSVAFEAMPIAGSLALKPVSLASGELKGNRKACLEMVHEKGSLKYGKWLKESADRGMTAATFKRSRTWLVANAYVKTNVGEYSVTEAGLAALGVIGSKVGSGD